MPERPVSELCVVRWDLLVLVQEVNRVDAWDSSMRVAAQHNSKHVIHPIQRFFPVIETGHSRLNGDIHVFTSVLGPSDLPRPPRQLSPFSTTIVANLLCVSLPITTTSPEEGYVSVVR